MAETQGGRTAWNGTIANTIAAAFNDNDATTARLGQPDKNADNDNGAFYDSQTKGNLVLSKRRHVTLFINWNCTTSIGVFSNATARIRYTTNAGSSWTTVIEVTNGTDSNSQNTFNLGLVDVSALAIDTWADVSAGEGSSANAQIIIEAFTVTWDKRRVYSAQ